MHVVGSYKFPAPPQPVWNLLINTAAISACLPGCESFDSLGENRYRVVLTMAVAAVSGRFEGTVEMTDLVPPHSYRLAIEGRGKPGFMTGGGTISLAETDKGTQVTVDGSIQVGGTIARVGQRLLGSVSKMMMDRFFTCLQNRLATQ